MWVCYITCLYCFNGAAIQNTFHLAAHHKDVQHSKVGSTETSYKEEKKHKARVADAVNKNKTAHKKIKECKKVEIDDDHVDYSSGSDCSESEEEKYHKMKEEIKENKHGGS